MISALELKSAGRARGVSGRFAERGYATLLLAGLAIAIISVAALSRYEVYLGERIGAQDDYIWLYMTAAKIGDRPRGDQLLQDINGVDVDVVHRLRADYEQNYLGVSAVYRVAAELTEIKYRQQLFALYPTYISSAMVNGFYVALALGLVFVASVLFITREVDVIVPVLLAVAAMSSLEALFPAVNQYIVDHGTWSEIGKHLGAFLLNPSFNFSIFGFTPRSTFALCVLGVAGLRMRGWFGASYVAIFVLSFVHQSYSGLLLFATLASDAFSRPQTVLRPSIWPFALATMVWFGAGQSIWQHSFGMSVVSAVAALVAAVALLVGVQVVWMRRRASATVVSSIPADVHPGRVLITDTAVAFVLWLLALPVTLSMTENATPEQWLYFWSQLGGRWMGIIRPLLFMTAGLLVLELLRRMPSRGKNLTPVVLALAIVLAMPAFQMWMGTGTRTDIIRRLELEFMDLDRAVATGSGRLRGDSGIYYAVSKALDTGNDASSVFAKDAR